MTYREQQSKLNHLDKEITFLNQLKGDYRRTLANIDVRLANLTKERVGIKCPLNTY